MSKTAIVFPGQGSQKLGMLQDYYKNYKIFRNIMNEAKEYLNFDLWNIIQNKPKILNKTAFTQPAILATSYAIYNILKREKSDFKVEYFAGHSLGEYTALLASGAISYKDALQIVHIRGKLMQNAFNSTEYCMSAIIGLSAKEVNDCCLLVKNIGTVEIANFNSAQEIIISGKKSAVKKVNILAAKKGAKLTKILNVSVPSHCSLMREVSYKFKSELNKIKFTSPKIKIIQNFNAKLNNNLVDIKTGIIKQLYKPVLWKQSIKFLIMLGVTKFIECGPNKILSQIIKRIDQSLIIKNTNNINSLKNIFKNNRGDL